MGNTPVCVVRVRLSSARVHNIYGNSENASRQSRVWILSNTHTQQSPVNIPVHSCTHKHARIYCHIPMIRMRAISDTKACLPQICTRITTVWASIAYINIRNIHLSHSPRLAAMPYNGAAAAHTIKLVELCGIAFELTQPTASGVGILLSNEPPP